VAGRRGERGGSRWPAPRKRLGQHFLHDPRVLERIASTLAPTRADTVVEIGPGRGALTGHLLAHAGCLVAIELDSELASRVRSTYQGDPRVTVIEGDVLDLPLAEAAGRSDFLVAGNIPYYITTPILFHALKPPRPRRAVYLMQLEVAQRVIAPPASEHYGALSVNVQALAESKLAFTVDRGAFTPPPTVDSALLSVVPRPDPVISDDEQSDFSAFVIAAFGMRRKQMRRAIRTLANLTPTEAERILGEADVAAEARPEVLTAHQFAAVHRALIARERVGIRE
jgi:16S rRNA (adenine1518-N6/adenine1519-N6)-dimethyltransferase